MDKLNKELVKSLALELMFDLSESEAENIVSEFDVLMQQLALLDQIDTTTTEVMPYPFEQPTSIMREDIGNHVLTQQEALRSAPKQKDGFVLIPKVVKA